LNFSNYYDEGSIGKTLVQSIWMSLLSFYTSTLLCIQVNLIILCFELLYILIEKIWIKFKECSFYTWLHLYLYSLKIESTHLWSLNSLKPFWSCFTLKCILQWICYTIDTFFHLIFVEYLCELSISKHPFLLVQCQMLMYILMTRAFSFPKHYN